MKDEMLTPRQAAALLGIRLDYLYRLIANGQLNAVRLSDGWKIPRSAVNAHLAKPRVKNYRAQLALVGA